MLITQDVLKYLTSLSLTSKASKFSTTNLTALVHILSKSEPLGLILISLFAKSVANRAVIVDGDIEHQTVGQTDTDVRIIININYME